MVTKIEWVKNPDGTKGETWNVVSGCTKVSEGCRNCYAARLAATRLRDHPRYRGLAVKANGAYNWTGEVRLNYDALGDPLRWRKARMVFVPSMGDLFHVNVPNQIDFIGRVLNVIGTAKQHTFQMLTKRPERACEILSTYYDALGLAPFENLWLGVSIENQKSADERIPHLLQTPAALRFLSIEPMLEKIDISRWLGDVMDCPVHGPMARKYWNTQKSCTLCMREQRCSAADAPHFIRNLRKGISWVIIGGESGPGARPMHPDWARDIRDQCRAAGVPLFVKQMGSAYPHRPHKDLHGTDMWYWPTDLRIRKMPGEDR